MIETFTTADITQGAIILIMGYFLRNISKIGEENKNEIKEYKKDNKEDHKEDRIRIRSLETNKISRQEFVKMEERILNEITTMSKDIKQLLTNQNK